MNDLQILRARGAPSALLDAVVAFGLPPAAARGAVDRVSRANRLWRLIRPRARLSQRELARLNRVVALARDVADGEGGAEGAALFWGAVMPWLEWQTPAYWLERGYLGAIEDLRNRINFGIPP